MSKPIAAVQTTSATLPANGRKIISGVNVAGILGCILPPEIGQDDVIRARNVKLSYEMAHSAITGQKSPIAFVQGLAFCAVVFSHGNKSLAQLQAGAPAWVQVLLANITLHFKSGAGTVTRAALETALDAGIKLTLALPAPAPAKAKPYRRPAITIPTIESKVGVDFDLTENQINRINQLADIADKRANESILLETQADYDAMMAAEAKAKEQAEAQKQAEGKNIVRIITEIPDREHAVTLIRAMAAHFGFELRKSRKAA